MSKAKEFLSLIEGKGLGGGKYDLTKYSKNYGRNKEMNKEVYALRRKVMDIVYEIKKAIPNLPRITVRITDDPQYDKKNVLGVGSMDDRVVVWIPEKLFEEDESFFRNVVFHEIGHAAGRLQHNNRSTVMKAVLKKLATEDQLKAFLKKELKPAIDALYN